LRVKVAKEITKKDRLEEELKKLRGKVAELDDSLSRLKDENRRLAAEEEKFRTLVENTVDLRYRCDVQGRITYLNRAWEDTLGYKTAEMIGNRFSDFQSPESVKFDLVGVVKHVNAGKTAVHEAVFVSRSGNSVYVRFNVMLLESGAGLEKCIIGTACDISGQKLIEDQLRQSQKMEAVGRLAGGIAHDFNNLLTAIIGYSEMLMMNHSLPENAFQNADEINRAAHRAAALTQQLLAYSRKHVSRPRVFNLNKLVNNLDKLLRRVIGENIEFFTVLEIDVGPVIADSGQVEQVIMNLAANARDSMPDGGELTFETRNVNLDEEYCERYPEVTPGPYVRLSVKDTGHGMDQETAKRIADPVFPIREAGSRSGLGMATVYGIVRQNGGHLRITSEVRQGTVIEIYLPRAEEGSEKKEPPVKSVETEGGNETVLVVEDERSVRVMVGSLLKGFGYRTIEAENGNDALEFCKKNKEMTIHLLIADIVMPDIYGFDLVNRVAKTHPGIKVMYISGYSEDDISSKGTLEKRVPFLKKPFTPTALARKVREVLDT
jgi:two-component system cell cycle sensor histidine kinase/response regulator CckA